MNKMIVVYYSWSNGNTEKIAKLIQKITASDIVHIETLKPYTGNYKEVIEQGKREVESRFKPEIKSLLVDFENYDVIVIGTPTWWYTMAPAVLSFLNNQNWYGKIIIPFITDAGWPGHVIDDIKKTCQGAEFAQEMEIRFDSNGGNHMETAESKIEEWIMKIKHTFLK
ncbi:flavodoxin [Pectinatus frisingensis]|uniref:flavodoxin n=1 Tax=Pectinatus frisingensis TaxID=865 RepID=UPI0018C6C165|nr:flavodoxin [Pectinatus frisingensis]